MASNPGKETDGESVMEKMREEFEAWYWAKLHGDRNVSLRRAVFNKTSDGSYRGLKCDTAWCAWKASRSALCVEVPENCKGMALTVQELHRELDKAGVSYK